MGLEKWRIDMTGRSILPESLSLKSVQRLVLSVYTLQSVKAPGFVLVPDHHLLSPGLRELRQRRRRCDYPSPFTGFLFIGKVTNEIFRLKAESRGKGPDL